MKNLASQVFLHAFVLALSVTIDIVVCSYLGYEGLTRSIILG